MTINVDILKDVQFRLMKRSDIPAIKLIENLCYTAPWSIKTFYEELSNMLAQYLVVTLNERVIGYCGWWVIMDEAHITNIAIHPDYRRCGLGRAFLFQAISIVRDAGIRKMTLEVRASNKVAQNLYKELGFVTTGVRQKYYSDNHEDALIMWVDIDEETDINFGNRN